MSQSSFPAGSPACSPTSSSGGSHDDTQLTPRSKVKALLASLDDSDDDIAYVLPKKGGNSRVSPTTSPKASKQRVSVEKESEDDEDAVLVPRGRLAARLQARPKENHASATSESEAELVVRRNFHNGKQQNQGNAGARSQLNSGGSFQAEEDELSRARDVTRNAHSPFQPDVKESQETGGQSFKSRDEIVHSGFDHESSAKVNRFAALVEKKRVERIAREAAEEKKRTEKAVARRKNAREAELSEVDSNDEDSESGVRLTQRSLPARKAGKKAAEEMARETQRISRNMQLAHEAKTKKKITKESLLARFKTKQQPIKASIPASSSVRNSSVPNSDGEGHRTTPSTSPESLPQSKPKAAPAIIPEALNLQGNSDDELPTLEEVLIKPINKGKSRTLDLSYEDLHPKAKPFQPVRETRETTTYLPEMPIHKFKESTRRPMRVLLPRDTDVGSDLDSDDDLEVVHSKVFRVFDNLPTKRRSDEISLLRLRALARLSSPSRNAHSKDKSNQTFNELTSDLRVRARQQAAAERAEKIKILRSKGFIIQTMEERQEDQLQVEDMLEKARQEVEDLTKKERQAAKKEAQANGEEIEQSSEDDEYQEYEEDDDDVELSGSGDEDNLNEEDDCDILKESGFVDDVALEQDTDREEEDKQTGFDNADDTILHDHDSAQDDEEEPIQPIRRRNIKRVLDDDDDDEENEQALPHVKSLPNVPIESPCAVQNPFGPQFGMADGPMGLTQAFAATMANSQLQEEFTQADSLLQLRSMPSLDFPNLISGFLQVETQSTSIQELDVDLNLTQTQVEHDTLPQNTVSRLTQLSQMPDPSQDIGFENQSPLRTRFATAPNSTIDTVIVPRESNSEGIKKRTRLIKRQTQNLASFSDEEEGEGGVAKFNNEGSATEEDGNDDSAFNIMRKAARKARRKELQFDKSKSEAKEMFEEQAQESEDEYAGLGGASDDSDGEEDEEIRRMIDEGQVDVNEREIAAYFA